MEEYDEPEPTTCAQACVHRLCQACAILRRNMSKEALLLHIQMMNKPPSRESFLKEIEHQIQTIVARVAVLRGDVPE